MQNLDLRAYANALIFSIENKRPMKARVLKGWQLKIVLSYIRTYLDSMSANHILDMKERNRSKDTNLVTA